MRTQVGPLEEPLQHEGRFSGKVARGQRRAISLAPLEVGSGAETGTADHVLVQAGRQASEQASQHSKHPGTQSMSSQRLVGLGTQLMEPSSRRGPGEGWRAVLAKTDSLPPFRGWSLSSWRPTRSWRYPRTPRGAACCSPKPSPRKQASKQALAHACVTLLCPLFGPVQGPPWLASGVAYLRCKFTYARPPGSWQRPRLRPCRQSWSRVLRPVHQLEARGLRRAAQRSGNAGSFKLDGQPASPRGGTR